MGGGTSIVREWTVLITSRMYEGWLFCRAYSECAVLASEGSGGRGEVRGRRPCESVLDGGRVGRLRD